MDACSEERNCRLLLGRVTLIVPAQGPAKWAAVIAQYLLCEKGVARLVVKYKSNSLWVVGDSALAQ